MTSFRKIVDDKLKGRPSYYSLPNAVEEALQAIADEMDLRYPKTLVVGDLTEEMIDSLNNYPGFLVRKKDR